MILRRYMTQQVAANTAIVLLFLMALIRRSLNPLFWYRCRRQAGCWFAICCIGYNIPTFLELIYRCHFYRTDARARSYVRGSGDERPVCQWYQSWRLTRLMIPLITGLFVFQNGN